MPGNSENKHNWKIRNNLILFGGSGATPFEDGINGINYVGTCIDKAMV